MTNGRSFGRLFLSLVSIAAVPFLSTCGSSSNGSCGKVQPCGGDIVGNWKVSGACINAASLSMQIVPNCTDVMVKSATIKATGNASFNADGTYSMTLSSTLSGSGTLPASCLQVSGLTLTCEAFDLLVQEFIATDPTMMVQSAHCSGSTDCSCSFTLAPQLMSTTGTYNTIGSPVLTLNASDGTVYGTDYCVQKNELHTMRVNATMPMGAMGQFNIDEDTFFTKQ
jgi:hypothetical protein